MPVILNGLPPNAMLGALEPGWSLETERLQIGALTDDDLDFVAEMLGDPEVMRFWPAPCSREEAADWIVRQRRRYAEEGFGYWLVRFRSSGEPVGQVGILRQDLEGSAIIGLGYIIHRPFWRQGIAFEAALACLRYGFESIQDSRIAVLVRPENAPSIALAKKLGGRLDREISYAGFCHQVYWIER